MSMHIEGDELSAFLDGATTTAEKARLDAHLADCADCRRELEALRWYKLLLASAPRKTMPADLALALERRFVRAPVQWRTLLNPTFWIPIGAVAAAALAVGVWLRSARAADELPLEPLLAAHARYSAEALAAQEHLVASSYSDQVTALYADASDSEPE